MTRKEEVGKQEKLMQIEIEKQQIEENRKTLDGMRERAKESKEKAKLHWNEELKRVQELKRKQEALNQHKLQ